VSTDFWIRILVSLLAFLLAVVLIKQSRSNFVKRLRAEYVRKRVLHKMHAILPIISHVFQTQEPDPFPLFSLRADLETLLSKSDQLFPIERTVLAEFLSELSSSLARIDAGMESYDLLGELTLRGQRVISELTDLSER
jgi:hypothetical protein